MKNKTFTTTELTILIILMIFSIVRQTIIFIYKTKNLNTIELNIANIVYIIFGYYLLFIKNVHGLIFRFYSMYLITKGILHFIYILKLYKLLGFSDKTNKELEERYVKFAFNSNIFGGILALIIIIKIFIL